MTTRTYFGHTNLVGREFQRTSLEDVLKDVSDHVVNNDNNVPLSVNVFFDSEAEQWTVVLVEDEDFFN